MYLHNCVHIVHNRHTYCTKKKVYTACTLHTFTLYPIDCLYKLYSTDKQTVLTRLYTQAVPNKQTDCTQ